jgi:hypothetical protein
MRYKIYFLSIILLLTPLLVYSQVTIHLKSGQTITGELIEENEDFVKIDYYGSELTYWHDDIEKIGKGFQGGDVLAEGALEKIYKGYLLALKNEQWLKVKDYVTAQQWDKLLEQDKRQVILNDLRKLAPPSFRVLQEKMTDKDKARLVIASDDFSHNLDSLSSGQLKFILSLAGADNKGPAEGKVDFVKEGGDWKISKIRWDINQRASSGQSSATSAAQQGTDEVGMVTGKINLPLTQVSKAVKGVVFITFEPVTAQKIGVVDYSKPNPDVYTVVFDADAITSQVNPPKDTQLEYTLESIAAGEYQARAVWDLTPPYCQPDWSGCPVVGGDYMEPLKQLQERSPVTVNAGELTQGVDFNCTNYLEVVKDADYSTQYQLVDIEYQKDSENKPHLFLTLKNNGDKPVREINIKQYINGKLLGNFFVSGKIINPGEQAKFDLIDLYKDYIININKIWQDQNLSKTKLDIRLAATNNQQQLRKTIVIDDLQPVVTAEDDGELTHYEVTFKQK